ncbi:esterase-like activity of phytase-domain-containing protein [Calycina marina]|uniref:Esterase-like activity of phytase-domain-containing protein n=1 Tax=Calycina marina TaxID=1763456 RepID=A0A9P7Z7G2_9HELO|nr:esterase-like activity of phytase-domain-containing protein [Calycina marina]
MSFLKLAFLAGFAATASATAYVNQTSKSLHHFQPCNGKQYTYQELAGYGYVPSNARDEFGDTIGGMGSALALDRSQWKKLANGSYTGVVWALPDRGWNTQGTLNFQPRVHKFNLLFTPNETATVVNPSPNNLHLWYSETIRFFGPDGTPCTGLDADATGHITFAGFPDLPGATYTGDGFGGAGPGGKRIVIDSEGIILNDDGTFWISDEYGPFIYRFSAAGIMLGAIRPVDAIIPMRNGTESFSADSPAVYDVGVSDDVSPADNPTGRDNNHGFEGLSASGDGKTLWVLLQAANNQEGGLSKQTQRYSRLLKYDITKPDAPRYAREFVVPLPLYNDPTAKASKNPKAAAQSDIFNVQGDQFFILSRDSSAGNGQAVTTSVYRQIDVFDISVATDVKAAGGYDCATCNIASSAGVLNSSIVPVTYCSFLDFNVNSQLNRFGLHNGGVTDKGLLNEKWESIGIVPVDGGVGDDDEWFVFSFSDNDFITQDGYMNGGAYPYSDASGFNLDNQALVFKISLPAHSRPFPRDP